MDFRYGSVVVATICAMVSGAHATPPQEVSPPEKPIVPGEVQCYMPAEGTNVCFFEPKETGPFRFQAKYYITRESGEDNSGPQSVYSGVRTGPTPVVDWVKMCTVYDKFATRPHLLKSPLMMLEKGKIYVFSAESACGKGCTGHVTTTGNSVESPVKDAAQPKPTKPVAPIAERKPARPVAPIPKCENPATDW